MTKGKKIRTYVLEPERRVVDHRTGMTSSDVRGVLDGDLQPFIEAYLAAWTPEAIRSANAQPIGLRLFPEKKT